MVGLNLTILPISGAKISSASLSILMELAMAYCTYGLDCNFYPAYLRCIRD